MSQTYKVRVKQSLAQVIKHNDEWRTKVEMLELLPIGEMGEILAKELVNEGWLEQDGKVVCKTDDWQTEFDSLTLQLKTIFVRETEVAVEFDGVVNQYNSRDNHQEAAEAAKHQVKQILQDQFEQQKDAFIEEARKTKEIDKESLFGDLEKDISSAVERTHVQALKIKASRLGEIKSVEEDIAAGEVTIRVKL